MGLVAATALLFLATALPALRDIVTGRAKRRETSAGLLPDMHILASRIQGAASEIATIEDEPDIAERAVRLELRIEDCGEELEMVAELLPTAPIVGLEFANELYVLRHLITQAQFELMKCTRFGESDGGDAVKAIDALRRAQRLYIASSATLKAAESCLPDWTRDIDGERFWDRFARVAREREADAAKQLLE